MKHDASEAAVNEAQADILAAKAQINVIAANRVEAEAHLGRIERQHWPRPSEIFPSPAFARPLMAPWKPRG